jgi:co-chaperonin GroES (HSP10)
MSEALEDWRIGRNAPASPLWTPPRQRMPYPDYLTMTAAERAELDELFPEVDLPFRPLHGNLTVQERGARKQTKGGVILSEVSQDQDRIDMNIGRVVAIGPMTFYSRDLQRDLPEEARIAIGEFVRIPKFSADRPQEGQVVWRNIEFYQITAVLTDIKAILR